MQTLNSLNGDKVHNKLKNEIQKGLQERYIEYKKINNDFHKIQSRIKI